MMTAQFVYLAMDSSKKYVKIGVTDNLKRREKEIKNMNPTFKMFYAWQPNRVTAYEAERHFHSYFAEKRVTGEWFDLSIDDLLIMTDGRGKYKLMSLLGRRS